jgi:hypothetical protein
MTEMELPEEIREALQTVLDKSGCGRCARGFSAALRNLRAAIAAAETRPSPRAWRILAKAERRIAQRALDLVAAGAFSGRDLGARLRECGLSSLLGGGESASAKAAREAKAIKAASAGDILSAGLSVIAGLHRQGGTVSGLTPEGLRLRERIAEAGYEVTPSELAAARAMHIIATLQKLRALAEETP